MHLHLLRPLILLASLTAANPCAQDPKLDYQSGPQRAAPRGILVMLTEFNPWALVVGWDPPTFVLYENGMVIYKKKGRYVSAKLSQTEVDAFMGGLRLDSLGKLKNSYGTNDNMTDLPTNVLVVRAGDSAYREISVHGLIRSSPDIESLKALLSAYKRNLLGDVRVSDTESSEGPPLPTELSAALSQILAYDNAHSSVWLPEYIEIFIWPFEYAKGEPADWPKRWPGLTDPKTVKRSDAYSLFMPGSQNRELQKFIARLNQTRAVRIDNKKWAVSARFLFPHEVPPIDK